MAVIRRALFLLCASGFCLNAQTAAPALPEGKGRAQVQRICSTCHGLQSVVKMRADKDQWSAVVDDMVSKGASGTNDDFDLIVRYLANNFGPAGDAKLEVNSASAAELAAALAISQADANAIVAYRTNHGALKEWSDLAAIPGIDLKKIEGQKDKIGFASAPAERK